MLPDTFRQLGESLEHSRLALYITLAASKQMDPNACRCALLENVFTYLYIYINIHIPP